MGNKTALYATHQAMGGKLVDFGGWDMPLHYGSQIEEHHKVRQSAGMFDVSHMTVVDVTGADAKAYLQYLLANDVAKLDSLYGKALYSGMLNHEGGVIDDLIVYNLGDWYRVVVNCSTREKDLAWMNQVAAKFSVTITERPELAMIAVQGPEAIRLASSLVSAEQAAVIASLKIFQGLPAGEFFIGRTGYTGEDGLEIMLPSEHAPGFWQALADAGVAPCGLGASDTLSFITLEKLRFSCDASRTSNSRARIRSPISRYLRFCESVLLDSEKGVVSPLLVPMLSQTIE